MKECTTWFHQVPHCKLLSHLDLLKKKTRFDFVSYKQKGQLQYLAFAAHLTQKQKEIKKKKIMNRDSHNQQGYGFCVKISFTTKERKKEEINKHSSIFSCRVIFKLF